MPRSIRLASLAILLASAARVRGADEPPPRAAATGKHCLGEARTRLLLGEGLYAQTNPLGLQNELQLGLCVPLIRTPGLLFDYTNVQAGAMLHASPVYAAPGAFVSVAPLSVLELRAEIQGIRLWTIGRDEAGYFPRSGADEQFEDLPASLARSASGHTAAFTGTLQAELDLPRGFTIVAVNSTTYAYWRIGSASHYYHPRYDLVLARTDWVGKNIAVLLLGRALSDRVKVRAGLMDELTWVRSSGYRANVLGALVAAVISRWPGRESETQPFLRIGAYTDHAFRGGELQLLAGIAVALDVTPGRVRPGR